MGDCERLRSLVILLKGLCLCFEGKTFDAVEVFDELSVSSLGSKPQGTRNIKCFYPSWMDWFHG